MKQALAVVFWIEWYRGHRKNGGALNPTASAQQRKQRTEEDAAYRGGEQNFQLSFQLEINIQNIKKNPKTPKHKKSN